jgi:hypothetical protein
MQSDCLLRWKEWKDKFNLKFTIFQIYSWKCSYFLIEVLFIFKHWSYVDRSIYQISHSSAKRHKTSFLLYFAKYVYESCRQKRCWIGYNISRF